MVVIYQARVVRGGHFKQYFSVGEKAGRKLFSIMDRKRQLASKFRSTPDPKRFNKTAESIGWTF